MARRLTPTGGTLVLDSEGLSKAAESDRAIQVHLEAAKRRDARVVISAVTIAETMRDPVRDANLNRAIKAVVTVDVDKDIARDAGALLGGGAMSGTPGNSTVDALVAATAIRQELPVLVLTSDPGDLVRLVDGTPVKVTHV